LDQLILKKTCGSCKEPFSATTEFFHRNKSQKYGLHSHCKRCRSLTMAKLQVGNPKYLQWWRSSREKLRMDALTAYGGTPPKCACCGEHRLEFLAIDHSNGDGAAHRRAIGSAPIRKYLWLKKHNYPPGFRVLCHNCNCARGFYGYCPHERESILQINTESEQRPATSAA